MNPDTTTPPKLALRWWILFAVLFVALLGATIAVTRHFTQQSSSPPSDGGRYATPQGLVAEMETYGVTCTRFEGVANPTGAVARGSCYLDEHQTPISIYATTADAKAEPARMNRLLGGSEVDMVVGVNWTVNCYDAAAARRVADAIGGQVVHLDKPTS